MAVNERRMEILEFLVVHRVTTLSELQIRFNISRSTAKRDIQELTRSYPIESCQGGGGGIFLAEWYRFGKKYLTEAQENLLKKLSENLTGEELALMNDIIETFSSTVEK